MSAAPAIEASKARLADLLAKNDRIADHVPLSAPAYYADYPVHGNVGDLMIALGTLRFFEKNGVEIRQKVNCLSARPASGLKPQKNGTIFLHGGGNFGDIYSKPQKLRENIVSSFPENKIIGLPQSVHYENPAAAARTKRINKAHPNLVLFVRDKWSLEFTGNEIDERVLLVPDMAHQLTPDFQAMSTKPPSQKSTQTLSLLRRDVEKSLNTESFSAQNGAGADWTDLRGAANMAGMRFLQMLGPVSTLLEAVYWPVYLGITERLVRHSAYAMNAYDQVQSSRLHGVIMALLLGKTVFPCDNSYGKIQRYLDTWFE
jgi:pyruvyl transferase EpsO